MRLKVLALAAASLLASPALAAPLASVFSDHAVLQRDQPIRVWGRAAPNVTVAVDLSGSGVSATAGADGRWNAVLPARPGGGSALTLTVQAGTERQVVSDLVMGDVWLCSGQSNMEYPLRRTLAGDSEVAAAADPNIRLLQTGKISTPAPQEALPASVVWKAATPQTASEFSAACFLLGKDLRKSTNVPIGLIDATWGGSVIQDWISREGLSALKTYDEGLTVLDEYARDPVMGQAKWAAMLDRWAVAKLGAANDGMRPDLDDRAWKTVPMENFWENYPGLEGFDGVVWLRTEIILTKAQAAQAAQGATLALGPVDDMDTTFVNGREIGATQSWNGPRNYKIAPGVLKAGRNVLAVRAIDTGGGGGTWGKAVEKGLRLDDGTVVPLSGTWRYKIAAPLSQTSLPPNAPWLGASGLSTLRNGMIAPLVPYGVKGFAWYQGEANVTEAGEYGRLMPAMIADWRQAFGAQPFLLVQLAAFGAQKPGVANSDWAALRDVQRRVAAADPKVGMASAVDIGSPYDIHPADKTRVGQRLALLARKIAYGEAVLAAGPAPLSARRDGADVVVTLDQPAVVYGAARPIGFELCDTTCRFVDATVDGATVRLVGAANATKVRYAWADSPIINLFGATGLPATPFEVPIQ